MQFCFNAGEIFKLAVDIEENGIAFYNEARQAVEDPELKEFFSVLVAEETEHKRQFVEFLSKLPEVLKQPTIFDPDNEMERYLQVLADQHVFGKGQEIKAQVAAVRTIPDALRLALQFEKDSVIFYLGMQEATCEGKARDLIALLIKEEQQHVRRLTTQLKRCSADARECFLNWPTKS